MRSCPVAVRFSIGPPAAARHLSDLRRTLLPLTVLFCLWVGARAQSQSPIQIAPSISAFAGTGTPGFSGDGAAGSAAQLGAPQGMVFNSAGDLFFSDTANNRVRKVSARTGIISTVVGTGVAGYSRDTLPAASTQLNQPAGLAIDKLGNLYIADSGSNTVRMMNAATGSVITIAGTGTPGFTGDGYLASLATLNNPQGVTVDAKSNVYISDTNNNRVRAFGPTIGYLTTIAGSGPVGAGTGSFSGDNGSPTVATLSAPSATVIDAQGDLFIADAGNLRVRAIYVGQSLIGTVAGNGSTVSGGDGGDPLAAGFASVTGIAVVGTVRYPSGSGGSPAVTTTLYIADGAANRVRATVVPGGPISTLAGTGAAGSAGDGGLANLALLSGPSGLQLDHFGNLYVADTGDNRIRKIQLQSPNLFPAASLGTSSNIQNLYLQVAIPASISSISVPLAAGAGQEYTIGTVTGCVVDGTSLNAVGTVCTIPITFKPAYPGVRSIPLQVTLKGANPAQFPQGTISFGLVGTGVGPLAALSPAVTTVVAGPTLTTPNLGAFAPNCAVPDSLGNLYLCDNTSPGYVLKLDGVTSALSIIAGSAGTNMADGQPATSARLGTVQSVAVDSQGNIFIASAYEVRKVSAADGNISAVVGSAQTAPSGSVGDGGPAISASTNPRAIALDAAGNLYIADSTEIRRVDTGTGIITAVVNANFPAGVAVDSSGNVFYSEPNNGRVQKLDALTGITSTVAGGGQGQTGDGGPATSATLSSPQQIWIDVAGDLYIADKDVGRVRRVDSATGIISTVLGRSIPFAPTGATPLSVVIGTSDFPVSVAIDNNGNMYVADNSPGIGQVFKLASNAAALTYVTPTRPGTIDTTDNPQNANLANIGNAPLILSVPASGLNPSAPAPAGWSLDSSSTCPTLSTTASPYTLNPGASCKYAYAYQPVDTTSTAATAVLTDNSASGNQQTIRLIGTPLTPALTATTLALSVTPAGQSTFYNSTFTFTVTVTHIDPTATGSVSGTVAIYSNGIALAGATGTINNGTATVVTTNITPFLNVFSAVFTPAGPDLNPSTSNRLSVGVNKAFPTSLRFTNNRYAYDGNPHGVTVSVSPSYLTYSIIYEDDTISYRSATPPTHAGSYDIYLTIGPDPNYGGNFFYANTLVITGIPASVTLSNLNYVFDGNPHSPVVTTNPVGLPVAVFYSQFGQNIFGSTPPSAVGVYTVSASISSQTNYSGSAQGTLIISQNTGSVWIVNQDSTVSRLSMTGSVLQTAGLPSGIGTLGGIAIDGANNAWSVVNSANKLLEVSPAGVVNGTFTGGGLNGPAAIAIDGYGREWIANTNNTISAFSGTGVPITPATGYQATTLGQTTALNVPRAIAIDATGSLWIANSGESTVTRVFGAAAPVVTPTAVAVGNAALGTRP